MSLNVVVGDKEYFPGIQKIKFEGQTKNSSYQTKKDTSIAGLRTPGHPVLFSRDHGK